MQAVAVCGIPDELLKSLFESIASVWLILPPLDLLKGMVIPVERKGGLLGLEPLQRHYIA